MESEELELGVVGDVGGGEVPGAEAVPTGPPADCSPVGCAVDSPGWPVAGSVFGANVVGAPPSVVWSGGGEPSVWIVACVAGVAIVASVVGVGLCGGYPSA